MMEIDSYDVIAIGSLFVSAITLLAGLLIFVKSDTPTISKQVIQDQEDCYEKIVALEKELSRLGHDVHNLEFSIDKWINENKELKAKMAIQDKESKEALDIFYFIVGWARAIQGVVKENRVLFDEHGIVFPEVPREVFLFEDKYNGRFKNG